MRLPVLLLLAILLSGCATRLRDTGTIPGGYTGGTSIDKRSFQLSVDGSVFGRPYVEKVVEDDAGPRIERTAFEDSETTRTLVFVVPEVKWLAPAAYPEAPQKEEEILFTVRERLYRYILRNYPHPTRVRYAFLRTDPLVANHRVITITANVTDFRKGNGALRYFVGYGAGQTYIQVEGEIFDGIDADRRIGSYAIRRANGGYAQNGLNTEVFRSNYALLYAVDEAIADLTEALPAYIPGVEIIPAADTAQ